MSVHPKKALFSKLYEKYLEKQKIEFEKQYLGKEISRSIPRTQKCLEKDCSCKKTREIEL